MVEDDDIVEDEIVVDEVGAKIDHTLHVTQLRKLYQKANGLQLISSHLAKNPVPLTSESE